ncbi:Golgi SNAP receptor complex member 1-2 [Platanthera guangdongensis]|uniref:Golgi SNAP receptor complex member 1-2 n=1 Tax=Platanthera guangdongensis TaxID=2320717 RepID=A0ABR2N2D7_9ASPA
MKHDLGEADVGVCGRRMNYFSKLYNLVERKKMKFCSFQKQAAPFVSQLQRLRRENLNMDCARFVEIGSSSVGSNRSWKSMEIEIESLLEKILDINDAMSLCAASAASTTSITQKLARHRDILHEYSQEFSPKFGVCERETWIDCPIILFPQLFRVPANFPQVAAIPVREDCVARKVSTNFNSQSCSQLSAKFSPQN